MTMKLILESVKLTINMQKRKLMTTKYQWDNQNKMGPVCAAY